MRHQQPNQSDPTRPNRPPCSKCGAFTQLARIEPSPESGYDLRTFERLSCGHSDVVTVKFN